MQSLASRSVGFCVALSLIGLFGIGGAVSALGGRPARPNANNPRTQSIFIHTVQPGKTIEDAATVSNATERSQTIDIYGVDALATNTGSLGCEQQAEKQDMVGGWITPSKKSVTLEPHTDTEVAFAVSVPVNAEPGEHNGCLVFQPQEETSASSGNVRIRTRQAVRVVVTVPGDLQKKLSIATFNVINSPTQVYTLETKNVGNVSVDTRATVTLKSLFGSTVFEDGGEYPVLPATQLSLRFENKKLPKWGGWYRAQATVAYDSRPEVFGVPKDQDQSREELKSQQITIFIMPAKQVSAGIIAVLILVMGGLVIILRLRRMHRTLHKKKE